MKVVTFAPGVIRLPLVAAVLALGVAAGGVAVRAETPVPLTPGACNGPLAEGPGGPSAPTDLSARWGPLPDNPQVSGVLLTWQDNAGDETCYVVQVRDSNGEACQDRIYASANATSTDVRVFYTPGDYCFRVFAANDHGASASNEACVQVPEVTVHGLPPGAATPGPPPNPSRCPRPAGGPGGGHAHAHADFDGLHADNALRNAQRDRQPHANEDGGAFGHLHAGRRAGHGDGPGHVGFRALVASRAGWRPGSGGGDRRSEPQAAGWQWRQKSLIRGPAAISVIEAPQLGQGRPRPTVSDRRAPLEMPAC